jgi:hypothetical protein
LSAAIAAAATEPRGERRQRAQAIRACGHKQRAVGQRVEPRREALLLLLLELAPVVVVFEDVGGGFY